MATTKTASSLKNSITAAIVFVSLLSLLISVSLTTYLISNEKKQEAANFISEMAEIIAYNSIVPVTFDQRKDLDDEDEGFLPTLEKIEEISHVHIYKYDEFSDELEFFASYNKIHMPSLTPKTNKVKFLTKPNFEEDYLEYAIPIIDKNATNSLQPNKPVGYVYVRFIMAHYDESLDNLIKYNVVIAVLVAVIAFAVSQYIQRKVLSPINRFIRDIQNITYSKSFEQKVESPDFTEMMMLADSVNTMLEKINRQILQYNQAEKEITELNQNLEEKVKSRTQALRDSNQELLDALEQVHQYQSQVIQSEKMASLGQMVAGVAHEVNTPIGLGVTASTMLNDKIEEITSMLEDKSLSAKKLEKFLYESKENTQIIYRNLSRAADLISSFKQVAVDQTADNIRSVEMEEFMREIIISLNPTLKKAHHEIKVQCDPGLILKTKPGPINQIIINLIMNSLIHGFKDTAQGEIHIKVSCTNNRCLIRYSDNGSGIEEKIKQKIFDPFVTTRRGEGGSGLGMHLVYNLVTQALNGNIEVFSELGEGAEFILEFPAIKVAG